MRGLRRHWHWKKQLMTHAVLLSLCSFLYRSVTWFYWYSREIRAHDVLNALSPCSRTTPASKFYEYIESWFLYSNDGVAGKRMIYELALHSRMAGIDALDNSSSERGGQCLWSRDMETVTVIIIIQFPSSPSWQQAGLLFLDLPHCPHLLLFAVAWCCLVSLIRIDGCLNLSAQQLPTFRVHFFVVSILPIDLALREEDL